MAEIVSNSSPDVALLSSMVYLNSTKNITLSLHYRPICSGFSSCTSEIAQFLDAFLKPLAQSNPSYVKDTSDFIQKIESVVAPNVTPSKTFLATMDVSSLYPNINHQEGINAFKSALDTRQNKLIPSSSPCDLLMTVLNFNTMKFGERFFHQVKGTSVGSPVSVNFANLFMGQFKTNMLNDYESKYNKLPGIWLRYIDDIFFTWNYDKTSLEHFINFCKNYSSNQSMKSHITFIYDYSTDYVYILDTKVKFKEQKLMTEIYSKPTASFQYLHRTSYHPPHTFRSILRSQFNASFKSQIFSFYNFLT